MTADLFGAPSSSAIQRSAAISRCKRYRWQLGRRWAPGAPVLFCMLNPSTANAERDDPTIRRCVEFARAWGFPALHVVNLYPLRSPSPAVLEEWLDGVAYDDSAAHAEDLNLGWLRDEADKAGQVICAWGAGAPESIVPQIAALRGDEERPLYCIGRTEAGAPKHPLARGKHRVPASARPVPWEEPS